MAFQKLYPSRHPVRKYLRGIAFDSLHNRPDYRCGFRYQVHRNLGALSRTEKLRVQDWRATKPGVHGGHAHIEVDQIVTQTFPESSQTKL